jgi:hypothetical protein
MNNKNGNKMKKGLNYISLQLGIIIILLSSSCVSNKHLISECNNCVLVNKTTIEQVNGSYNSEIWKYIAPLKKSEITDSTTAVRLTVMNEKKILAELVKGNEVLAKKMIKGKIKNNVYSVRKKVYPIGFPFIFLRLYSNKIDISITDENELFFTVNKLEYTNVLLFFIQTSKKEDFCEKYNKL